MFKTNNYNFKVKMCCASCAFKEFTRTNAMRMCTRNNIEVPRCYVCDKWKMSKGLMMAGNPEGRVKKYEYLMQVLFVRQKEQEAGIDETLAKSIEEIRSDYEKNHGSIFINL